MTSSLSRPPYENILVKSKDGLDMFTCHSKRANWYLTRNLAEKISEDPTVIKLKFETKGNGHHGDPYFLQNFQNICVVCGTSKNLTRHHVFPQQFNKFVPREFKDFMRSNSYNVKLLCIKCHENYEAVATQFKFSLLEENGFNVKRYVPEYFDKAKRAAWAIINYRKAIPENNIPKLLKKIERFLCKKYPVYEINSEVEEDLKTLVTMEHHLEPMTVCYEEFFRQNIKTLEDLNDFVILWRNHFVTTMFPRYMPEHWHTERRFNDKGK